MTNQSLLAAWGVTTTAGYLLTHAMGVAGTEVFGMSVFGSIVAVWALLMLPPDRDDRGTQGAGTDGLRTTGSGSGWWPPRWP